AEQNEALGWIKSHPGSASILKASRPVPTGNGIAVLKTMPDDDRRNLLRWATSADAAGFGKLQAAIAADTAAYSYLATLGILTPPAIAGVTLVDASEVARLIASGAIPVDTRTPKEFAAAHIAGAINLPYIERSLKEKDFNADVDDFSALARAPAGKALIFFCNGPECWKSYKASRLASGKGYKSLYWYRKGMPDWRDKAMPVKSRS
ncbi:MAG: rhodanese-like domain-containing protein, partial [Janthinobacterium lividum]